MLVLEKQGTIINHTILNLENGELYGFPVEPTPPERALKSPLIKRGLI